MGEWKSSGNKQICKSLHELLIELHKRERTHASQQQAHCAAHGQTVLPDPASVNIPDSES